MISDNDQINLYHTINNSNMKQLSRIYNRCNRTCVFPLQCTFGFPSIFYKVLTGNYDKSSNTIYNTILTFTEDVTIQLFTTTKVYVTIALQTDPSVIIDTFEGVQAPGIYTTPAGTLGAVIILYVNFPKC
jgi:hypothetical protein